MALQVSMWEHNLCFNVWSHVCIFGCCLMHLDRYVGSCVWVTCILIVIEGFSFVNCTVLFACFLFEGQECIICWGQFQFFHMAAHLIVAYFKTDCCAVCSQCCVTGLFDLCGSEKGLVLCIKGDLPTQKLRLNLYLLKKTHGDQDNICQVLQHLETWSTNIPTYLKNDS